MADLRSRVGSANDAFSDLWEPELLRHPDHRERLDELAADPHVEIIDTLTSQLEELVSARAPAAELAGSALDEAVEKHLQGRDPLSYGTWVHYPWSRRLVHLLPVTEYREVRTNRNLYKITPAEQAQLGAARVGVIGLSVGNMAAVTMAIEGIGGVFKIADFDRLSLSNLNRLRSGAHCIGMRKTTLAAREMLEIG